MTKRKQKTGKEQWDESLHPAFRFSDKGEIPSIKKMKKLKCHDKKDQNK